MGSKLKISGIIILIAVVIASAIWLYTSQKSTNQTGGADAIKKVASAAVTNSVKVESEATKTSSPNKENSMHTQDEQPYSNYKSFPIMPGVWEITDGTAEYPSYVDIYLVEGTEKALVIDAGVTGSDLEGYIRTLTDKPLELVLTHGHVDHVASVDQFKKVYMSSKDFNIAPIRRRDFKSSGFFDLKGGEVLELGGCKIEVIALPGHTQGSVVLLDREREILFAGDAIGSGSLWLQLSESSPVEEFRDEIRVFEKKLEGLKDLKVYLGHSCLMGQKPNRDYITDTRIAAEKIVSGEIIGTPSKRSDFPWAVFCSNGQMTEFLYRPERILKDD